MGTRYGLLILLCILLNAPDGHTAKFGSSDSSASRARSSPTRTSVRSPLSRTTTRSLFSRTTLLPLRSRVTTPSSLFRRTTIRFLRRTTSQTTTPAPVYDNTTNSSWEESSSTTVSWWESVVTSPSWLQTSSSTPRWLSSSTSSLHSWWESGSISPSWWHSNITFFPWFTNSSSRAPTSDPRRPTPSQFPNWWQSTVTPPTSRYTDNEYPWWLIPTTTKFPIRTSSIVDSWTSPLGIPWTSPPGIPWTSPHHKNKLVPRYRSFNAEAKGHAQRGYTTGIAVGVAFMVLLVFCVVLLVVFIIFKYKKHYKATPQGTGMENPVYTAPAQQQTIQTIAVTNLQYVAPPTFPNGSTDHPVPVQANNMYKSHQSPPPYTPPPAVKGCETLSPLPTYLNLLSDSSYTMPQCYEEAGEHFPAHQGTLASIQPFEPQEDKLSIPNSNPATHSPNQYQANTPQNSNILNLFPGNASTCRMPPIATVLDNENHNYNREAIHDGVNEPVPSNQHLHIAAQYITESEI